PESALDGRSLEELDLPVETGMRPIAVRSGSDWNFDPDPEDVLRESDVLFLQGPPEGVAEVREMAGAAPLEAVPNESHGGALGEPEAGEAGEGLSELERAVDILIEMKNLSEVAVGLAYSALLYYDAGLAREVVAIEDEMDEMRYRLERWVLLAARHVEDAPRLRGILHLATASEAIADCAQEMVWIVEKGEEVHPVLSAAVGESDEVVLKLTVVPGSPADGRTLGSLRLETETGMYVLAVNRGGRWTYRPRDTYTLQGGDSLLASGAPEGLEPLAELFGQELEELRD
ncbi:MAG TPA: TrkA C-terminal domain-containing protein, partial [Rubrobacter sp.]|nr:TrkA C-terminal domain-containing protein [Rubrobacter sp.]